MGVDELLMNAENLSVAEQLRLVTSLLDKICHQHEEADQFRLSWSDISGVAPSHLVGEDAQGWVARGRCESDAHRESLLRS